MKIDRLTPTVAILAELGQRLARIRKQQGFTQQGLAAAAGIGIATLRRIEDGKDGKLGSWLRLLLVLQLEVAVDQLLPETYRSPLAEAKRGGRRAAKKPTGFVWGDERP
jgi:transcriptional regulator with XRE-family HTH domain